MKMSWLKRIASVLLLAMSASMSMQAETAKTILNAVDGDTITFAYSNNNAQYYLMAGKDGTSIVAVDKVETDLLALWKVKNNDTNGFRLQNIGNGKWLKVDYTPAQNKNKPETYKYSLVDKDIYSTLFVIEAVLDKSNYTGIGRGFANISFPRGTNKGGYPFYDSNGKRWWGTNDASVMRMEQWSKRDSSRVEITTNSGLTDLSFVRDNKCGTAAEQKFDLIYTSLLHRITYLYNVPETHEQNSASDIELSRSTDTLTTSPTFAWASNQMTTSKLTDGVDNTGEIMTETVGREMLTFSGPTGVNSNKQWRITVTPIGNSPINLKKDGKYVDYMDDLQAKVVYGGKEYVHSQTVLRRAGHYVMTDSLYVRVTPASYLFDPAPYTASFKSQFELVSGGKWLNIDGDVLKNNGCIYSDTTHLSMTRSQVGLALACFNENGTPSAWLTAQGTGDGNFTATVTQNTDAQARHGEVVVTYEYVTQSHTYKTIIPVSITQLGTTAGDYVAFHHSTGVGNTDLDARGYQPVHTVEKTIYYAPGADVKLQLNETAFLGYDR